MRHLGLVGHQLLPALRRLTVLAVEQAHHLLTCERVQRGLGVGSRAELVHPAGARLQLRRRLRPTQQQHGEQGHARWLQSTALVEHLAVAGGAATVRGVDEPHQSGDLERVQRGEHLVLVDVHHRLPRRRLVARPDEGVGRQRILVRGRPLLLQQAADDPALDDAEHERRR